MSAMYFKPLWKMWTTWLFVWCNHSCTIVQFQMVAMHWEKPISTPPNLTVSEVSPTLPLLFDTVWQFQCLSDWRWPSLILWRKIHFAVKMRMLSWTLRVTLQQLDASCKELGELEKLPHYIIIIMEICKSPTCSKHWTNVILHIMCIEMENVICN